MAHDHPRARQRDLDQLNARVVRLMGTDLLTVRMDLDPEANVKRARKKSA